MVSVRSVTSPYLSGGPARQMRAQCAYCCHPLTANHPKEAYRLTKDHILPRERGRLPGHIWNIRPSCYRCNQERAKVDHCSAVLVLMIEEARVQHLDLVEAMIKMGLRRSNKAKKEARDRRVIERLAAAC